MQKENAQIVWGQKCHTDRNEQSEWNGVYLKSNKKKVNKSGKEYARLRNKLLRSVRPIFEIVHFFTQKAKIFVIIVDKRIIRYYNIYYGSVPKNKMKTFCHMTKSRDSIIPALKKTLLGNGETPKA